MEESEPTLKGIIANMANLMLSIDETLLNILDALGGIEEGITLLSNYPRTGKKTLGIGIININTVSGDVSLTDGTVEHMTTPIDGVCRSLLFYCNREVDLELNKDGMTTLSTSIAPSWMRYMDIPFNSIKIVTTVATKVYLIVSNVKDGVPTMDRLIQKGLDENLSSWDHEHKTVTAAGTAEQLDAMEVPSGIYMTVRAFTKNVGNIYVGNSKANAEDVNKRLKLQPGESSSYKVDDADLIWIDADNDGEGVEYWY